MNTQQIDSEDSNWNSKEHNFQDRKYQPGKEQAPKKRQKIQIQIRQIVKIEIGIPWNTISRIENIREGTGT